MTRSADDTRPTTSCQRHDTPRCALSTHFISLVCLLTWQRTSHTQQGWVRSRTTIESWPYRGPTGPSITTARFPLVPSLVYRRALLDRSRWELWSGLSGNVNSRGSRPFNHRYKWKRRFQFRGLDRFGDKLKLLSKLIRILRITFCYTQLCGRCLVSMTPVVNVAIHCVLILQYYKQNTLAIIIIYKEQRACRLIVTSRMSTNAGNRGPLKRMNTASYYVRHIVPLLWTQCQETL